MQPLSPPKQFLPPWTSNIFVARFSKNPLVNQFMGTKSSCVPGQINLCISQVPQQRNPPQSNTPNATQLPNAHLPHNFSPFLNPHVVKAPVIPLHHLLNSHVPVIPTIIAPQLLTLINQHQNPVRSSPDRSLTSPAAPKLPFNYNSDLNLWRFPQNNPKIVNQVIDNAAVYNNFQPTLSPSTANPASSHAISQ